MNQDPPARVSKRNGMKVTPMKRTPLSRAPKPVEEKRIAGKLWPYAYMKESKFQAHVESIAHGLGWMTSHSHLPFFDDPGWPDLAMVHPKKHRFMVRELKVTSESGRVGKPTPKQSAWLSALSMAGVDAGVWTWPFDDQAIYEELAR